MRRIGRDVVPVFLALACLVSSVAAFSRQQIVDRRTALPVRASQPQPDEIIDPQQLSSRRTALTKITTFSTLPLALATPVKATTTTTTTIIPLEYIPALNAYVVHFYLFGERFGAIVDTGSPFLTVPSTCNKWAYKYIWGCYHPERTKESGYSNTVEGFDNNYGTVVWRKAEFQFQPQDEPTQEVVFGVLGPDLMDGPGGVFLGLIQQTDQWIRPSFLGQTNYQSFCVDLRDPNPQLVLSSEPMIHPNDDDYISLTNDLNRRYKAPVVHYTAKASGFEVNGLSLRLSEQQPTYVIFDTGVTGMVVSQELFDGRYLQARKNKEKSLWGQVTVSFTTQAGQEFHLSATKPVTTPLGKATPWRRFKGNLIVVGLAFLNGKAMTIDIHDGKLQFTS